MCEYCGCQALTAIAELTREHDQIVNLIGDVRAALRADDTARMAEVAQQITAILGPHTTVEEHGLFPALADEFPDHIAALHDEHRQIEQALAEGVDLDTLEMLREHILKEQDGVFPAALATLSTEQWQAVEDIRAQLAHLTLM